MTKGWGEPEGIRRRAILVRHGEVHADHRHLLYGGLDVPLSDLGLLQSERTARTLAAGPVGEILTSDLSRASMLGGLLSALTDAPHESLPALRERSFGEWQGLPMADLIRDHPEQYQAYMRRRWDTRVAPGAETFEDVHRRVLPPFRAAVSRATAERPLVVVSHSGPMRAILLDALELPGASLFRMKLSHCSITIVDYYDSGEVIVDRLNDTSHLAMD